MLVSSVGNRDVIVTNNAFLTLMKYGEAVPNKVKIHNDRAFFVDSTVLK